MNPLTIGYVKQYHIRVIKPPTTKLGRSTREKSPAERRMIANGWNAHLLHTYIVENHKEFSVTYPHLWRLLKGDTPWADDELRQLCNKITGAKFTKGTAPIRAAHRRNAK